ncbi:putative Chromosome segregation protein SudA [Pseudohyphozyma bogoriensis]|nr:putative Chromosome segregation protein SudA [Pseudohyphozyma bogoriensis]
MRVFRTFFKAGQIVPSRPSSHVAAASSKLAPWFSGESKAKIKTMWPGFVGASAVIYGVLYWPRKVNRDLDQLKKEVNGGLTQVNRGLTQVNGKLEKLNSEMHVLFRDRVMAETQARLGNMEVVVYGRSLRPVEGPAEQHDDVSPRGSTSEPAK